MTLGDSNTPVDASSVTTSTITDSTDSGAWESLREAGYEVGDFVPVIDTSGANTDTDSTTSGTYVDAANQLYLLSTYDDEFPTNGTAQAKLYARVTALNGTTISIRVQNTTDAETVVESTGISSTGVTSIGFTNYTPTTTASPTTLVCQIRSGDGASTVTVRDARFVYGVST